MSRVLLKDNVTLYREDGSSVKFHIKAHIGSGASCVVYHAVCEDKTEHLLKEYYPRNLNLVRDEDGTIIVPPHLQDKFNDGIERFRSGNERQKEVRLSENLKNFTSNVQGYFYGNGTEYIDMTVFAGRIYSKVENETLHDLMLRMRTLAQVIGYYHDDGLLHLDIKPDNIFVRPENETVEDVMLFDFDSVIEQSNKMTVPALSYTKDWAAPEQLLPYKRGSICEATDLFSIGEIIFAKIFGRHSTQAERRSFAEYDIDYKAPIFENVNPKVVPLIKELFRHTLCAVPARRYQTAVELIEQLDKIIKLSNPKEPFIKKGALSLAGFFTGRDAEMQAIHEKFKETDTIFLSGIGGIGKSELAKHYAKMYENEYDAIIFAPFVNDVKMMIADDNYVPIYNFSQYPEEKADEYFVRKMRKLGELCDKRTLIIIDNLDTADDENMDKLFALGCKMLVTTRMDFSDVYPDAQIDVGTLSNPAEVFNEHYKKPLSDEDRIYVDEIIEIVCGHTMTVELLAKQMMAGRVKPEKMLDKLKNGGVSDSGKEKVRTAKDGKLVIQSTSDHIQALFDLSELDEDEKYVLDNLALVPHTGIAANLFCKWCEIGGFDTINELVVEGWVRWDRERDYISLHSLLSEIVLDNADDTTVFEGVIKEYTSHLRERNSADIVNSQDHCEDSKINIHLLNMIERYNFENSFFEILLNGIGGELFIVHQFDLALKACELAAKIAVKNNPTKSYAVTESMSQMALIKASIGAERKDSTAIREAIDIYLQAIENHKTFDENEYPDNYEEIATLYSYAGMAYEDLEENDSAREMYSRGIAIYAERMVLNSDDYLSLGILYNNLGNTYSGSESLKYYLAAKENHDESGTLTRHAAVTLYHLADVYSCEDDSIVNLDLAVEYAKRVLEFFENEYSDDLYMIGEAKYMLGKIYSQFDDASIIQNAYTLLKEAEEIFVQFLPPEDNTIIKICELKEKVHKQFRGW